MKHLIEHLRREGCSLVVENNGTHLYSQPGIADLRRLLKEQPGLLAGASVADKVVGKAAAALLIAGKVRRVYAALVSVPAIALLDQYGVELYYGEVTDHIENRRRTGWCPMEQLAQDGTDALDIVNRIEQFIKNNHKTS